MSKPHKGTIENWHVISMIYAYAIVGIIDGKRIRTSEIVTLKHKKVETLNSVYQLGEPLLEDSEVLDRLRVILDNKGETEC